MTSTAPEKALISSFLLAKRRVLWGVLRQHPSLSSPSSSWRKLAISSPDPSPPVPWHTARPCSPATFKVRRGHVIESSSMGTEVTETSPHMGHNPHTHTPHPPEQSIPFPFPQATSDACHPLEPDNSRAEGAPPSDRHTKETRHNQGCPLWTLRERKDFYDVRTM